MMNSASLDKATQTRKKINYKNLLPHQNNHYSLDAIEELADSIQDVGLLQDLVVKPSSPDGKYTIVIGHRRHKAITTLVEERGLGQYADISCNVIPEEENEIITQLKLHLTNVTAREMTEYDKMQAIAELKRLIQEARDEGFDIKGKTRDIIAGTVNLGATQVQKYLSIAEDADAEVHASLRDGKITVQDAYDSTRPKAEKRPTKESAAVAAPKAPTAAFDDETGKERPEYVENASEPKNEASELKYAPELWSHGTDLPTHDCWVAAAFNTDGTILRKLLNFKNGRFCFDSAGEAPIDITPTAWYELPELPDWVE